MCVPGTSPKHVWASYSRPDAHRGPRTLEIVAPTQIQWQNHVTTQPRRHQRLHCHTHEGGRGHSGLQNTQRDLKGRLGPPPEARRPCRKALIDFHRDRGNMNYETQNYSGNLECQRYSKLEGFRLPCWCFWRLAIAETIFCREINVTSSRIYAASARSRTQFSPSRSGHMLDVVRHLIAQQ